MRPSAARVPSSVPTSETLPRRAARRSAARAHAAAEGVHHLPDRHTGLQKPRIGPESLRGNLRPRRLRVNLLRVGIAIRAEEGAHRLGQRVARTRVVEHEGAVHHRSRPVGAGRTEPRREQRDRGLRARLQVLDEVRAVQLVHRRVIPRQRVAEQVDAVRVIRRVQVDALEALARTLSRAQVELEWRLVGFDFHQ